MLPPSLFVEKQRGNRAIAAAVDKWGCNPKEAAAYLRLPRATLSRLVSKSNIGKKRQGGAISFTYKSSDLARISDQRIESVIKASGMIEFPAFLRGVQIEDMIMKYIWL